MKLSVGNIALGLCAGLATTAVATDAVADNSRYGETRINQLPTKGKLANKPWVGSWWAYTKNGIAYRHKRDFAECRGVDLEAPPQTLVEQGKQFCLSAAEKVDYLSGKLDKVEWDQIKEYQRIAQQELSPLQTEIRNLVRTLNRWIDANPGQDWRTTDDGKRYLELNQQLDEKKGTLPTITVDTATEFEHIEHGNGVPGVEGWWGHCNAWAAAAMMEIEPNQRGSVTVDGRTVEFTPGEVKALYTEAWMEHHSSFIGSRNNDPANEDAEYKDLTPAATFIYAATQLGIHQKGFVLDRFTGSEVWNQTARSYAVEYEKLYENDQPEEIEIHLTEYDRNGKPKQRSLGVQRVYPVQVDMYLHWMTDGLPHEEHTRDNILADVYPKTHSELQRAWGNQVEMREITFTLYLDKPLEDPAARIVGDGKYAEALIGDNHAWPDFYWQPLAQTPSVRRYENPNIDFTGLVNTKIGPATTSQPTTGSEGFVSSDTPLDIPDNNPTGIASHIDVDAAGRIVTAAIIVDITHTYRGDLRVVLEKDGAQHVLHDRAGGGADDLKATFDLPALAGKAAAGRWTLKVTDLAGQDVGKLNSWEIDLTTDEGDPIDEPARPTQEVFNAAGLPLAVPDNDPTGVGSTIRIDKSGTLTAAKVSVDIGHTYKGDLLVVLVNGGQTYTLHNRSGGSADNVQQTFTLDALVGKQLRGDWTLKVSDHARRDVGSIKAWSLDLTWR